ncbi:MAG TPA: hypothetical protein VKP12_14940 [Kiloniellaceae bacterium]|nr:hypothetical protein [Kiloniellaceae bacterium]
MVTGRLYRALTLAAALTPLAPSLADAAIVAANGSPARVAVAASGPATVSLSWQLVRDVVDPPVPGTVSSPSVQIMLGAEVVTTLPRALTRNAPGATTSENLTLRETLTIPEAAIYRSIKQGTALRLVRTFTDSVDAITQSASVEVTPSGPGSVALEVGRLDLAFDDEARTRVLSRGSALQAVAELSTHGVGLLTGQWEVADAASTAGTPVFRPLSLVRQGVAGGGRTVITSPRLPTGAEGTHLVRFRLTDPAFAFATPTLQYYVTPSAPAGTPDALSRIAVAAPEPGSALTAETRFAWSPVAGAQAYQLTFHATPAGPAEPPQPTVQPVPTAGPAGGRHEGTPLAGLFVAGDRTEAVPAAFTLAQLPAGRSYLWQVLAIDDNGAVIGSSSPREIYKP